jgi:glycosyltransferase involved in cell wall biosynthesis
MRVAHVIDELGYGGAERQLSGLVTRSQLEHEIVEFDRLAHHKLGALRALRRELDRHGPEVVIGWLERSQIALALIPLRCPIVACIRGRPRRARVIDGWKLRLAFARYDCFVTNSEDTRTATLSFAQPLRLDHFVVIPNGVDLRPAAPPARRDGALRIGFIGRAPDPDKGLDVLLRALDYLRPDEVTARFVGNGVPEAVGGRHAAVSGVDDPWGALGEVDLLVVPSRNESSPNVVIEAFARGVPVLGTNVGGMRALIADGRGVAVEAGNPTALAGAIRRVANAPDVAATRAAKARRYVELTHSWPHIAAAYDALCLRLGRTRF